MKKKITVLTLCVALLALCGSAAAQQAGKLFRVGFLDSSNAAGMAGLLDVFRQELSKLGWIEGKNIAFEYRFAEGNFERLPELAAELVRMNVEVIWAHTNPSAFAAKSATRTIPIVVWGAHGAFETGLVQNLARPGGNLECAGTDLSHVMSESCQFRRMLSEHLADSHRKF